MKGSGGLLVVVGGLGLAYVYSMRPPSGLGDAFGMMMQGRQSYIRSPTYEVLMAACIISVLFGLVLLTRKGNKSE